MRNTYIYKVVFSVISILATVTTSVFIILNVIGIVWWPTIALVSPSLIAFAIMIVIMVVYIVTSYVSDARAQVYGARRRR
jgi:Na+/glutamate symporter